MDQAPQATQAHGRGVLRACVIIAVVAGAAALCYFTIDVPAAVWSKVHDHDIPNLAKSILDGARSFGQVFTIALAVCLVLALDRKQRRNLILFVLTMVAVAIVVNTLKAAGGRIRPYAYIKALDLAAPTLAFPHEEMWHFLKGFAKARYSSFPSAHAAAAFAMAAVMTRMYPRATWVFLTTAALCAISRVTDLQHYPSDIIVGGAIGLWLGFGMWRWRWSTRIADEFEDILARCFRARSQDADL